MNFRSSHHLFLVYAVLTLSANATEIDLGGLRMVRATLTHESSRIVCKVSFIPVTCFDAGTNLLVNGQKARMYVVHAITKAHGHTPGTVVISNLTPVAPPDIVANRYVIAYVAKGVEVVRKDSLSDDAAENESLRTRVDKAKETHELNLLTCFEDTRSTLHFLVDAFQERISSLQVGDDLDDQIASLEQIGVEAFGKLASEVEKQKLLLRIEKVELISHVNRKRDAFLKSLAKAYQIHQRTTKP